MTKAKHKDAVLYRRILGEARPYWFHVGSLAHALGVVAKGQGFLPVDGRSAAG